VQREVRQSRAEVEETLEAIQEHGQVPAADGPGAKPVAEPGSRAQQRHWQRKEWPRRLPEPLTERGDQAIGVDRLGPDQVELTRLGRRALEQALDDDGQVIDVDRLHAPGPRPEPERQRCRGEQLRAPAAGPSTSDGRSTHQSSRSPAGSSVARWSSAARLLRW
jgi:hypothetical protein